MSNCSKHKKEVAGISDMKVVAEMIGDLHYKTLADFFQQLKLKFSNDAEQDANKGREHLAFHLENIADCLFKAEVNAAGLWKISKPFMESPIENEKANSVIK